jgi:hypothetical protein
VSEPGRSSSTWASSTLQLGLDLAICPSQNAIRAERRIAQEIGDDQEGEALAAPPLDHMQRIVYAP